MAVDMAMMTAKEIMMIAPTIQARRREIMVLTAIVNSIGKKAAVPQKVSF